MLTDYSAVLVFMLLAIGFVLISLVAGSLIRPHLPNPDKNSIYECGERPVGNAWINFNIRFYVLALIFLLFDVEVVFIFPVAVVYKSWLASHMGFVAMIELLVFVAILFVALVYAWGKGDLDWVKTINRHHEDF